MRRKFKRWNSMDYKKRFFNYLKPERTRIVFIAIFVLLFVTSQLSIPFLVGRALDNALAGEFNVFLIYIIISAALALIGVLSGYIFENNVGILTQNIIKEMRDDIYTKYNKIPISYLYKKAKGDLVQLEINDVENIANGMSSTFKSLLEGVLMILITIVMMFYLNWILALGVILLSPLSVLMSRFVAKYSHKYFKKQAELQASLNSISFESVNNLELIQSYNYEEKSLQKFNENNEVLRKHGRIALFSASWINPSTRLVNNTIYALIGVIGIIMIALSDNKILLSLNATMSIGALASFLSYTTQYTKPFNEISGVMSEYETALFSLKRLNDFLNEEDDLDSGNLDINNIDTIKFSHVDFSYDKNEELIKNFNTVIQKGQKVAIVGPTGAGKTTLINLLMNFYPISGGDIYFDNLKQREIKKANLRKNIGMVLQESWIFDGTIMENIRYGNINASDEEVIQICKDAHIDGFINTLPFGYNTKVSSKEGLSTGEKQLITIARVMLMKPDIVILDEATSNVDTRSEKLINEAFDKMMKGHTSIVIAHRLSTIKSADIILVLKDGKIIEQGNHNSLMDSHGFYYSMYSSQFSE